MAEAIANELVKVIFQKMTDEAFKRIARAQGIQNELKELAKTLARIQNLLIDASEKEVTDKTVKSWLNGLQNLAYDIDDVLDDVATEAMHRELTAQEPGASTSKVRKLIPSCCTNFSLSHRLSPKLDSITTQLQDLEKQKSDLGLIKKDKPRTTSSKPEASLPEPDVVGREVEKEKLLNKLLGDDGSSKENFSIVPIVGMGGVGKTTLARLLYNDTKVKGHFELKVWVYVSKEFDIIKISDTILQYVTRENKDRNNECKDLNQLQMALAEQFKEKRFLLVVDDVWSENYDDWENLVRPFRTCAHGSRIIMTTRNDLLLKKLGFQHLDCLEHLSHENALSLLALHALGVDNFDSHTTLKAHGKGIVNKCGHLPLAIKAIGRLLRTKTYLEDWDNVLNSEIWDIENGKHIIPALILSYHDLSADLKQLFAYCSLFPKGFLFNKEDLVLLWVAEGFLNPSNATKSKEWSGHEYFDILLSRSFFQYALNEETMFIMHDLMVDLATFVAGNVFLRFEDHRKKANEALEEHRHMSFICEEYVGYHKFEAFKGARSLRTLLALFAGVDNSVYRFYLSNKILVDLLPMLPMLRVLSLSSFYISEVPECIGDLKHLRYLNLCETNIKELPESVGNLYNLETLIVFGCWELTKLPKSFLKLKRLRHFDIRYTPLLEKLPLGISKLESLETLNKIIIEGDDGFAITELRRLKNLHGNVYFKGLHKIQNAMHARAADLSLKRITKLGLEWVDVFDGSRRGILEKVVLDELKPNSDSLKDLEIVSYGGPHFSNWVGDPSFNQLVSVSISGCRKCASLPPLGGLPSLKKLSIKDMTEVKVIGSELTRSDDVVFPSLETLEFEDMVGWNVWSTNSKAMFPCLQNLCIKKCANLVDISLKSLPSLEELILHECGDVVLRSLVVAASSITTLEINSILGLNDEVWRGVLKNLGAVEKVKIEKCDEIRYLWESEAQASKVLLNIMNLTVNWCENLVSLGEKEEDNFGSNLLSSLRTLDVSNCDKMGHVCCPNSNIIESLEISYCKSVTRVFFPTTGGQKLKSLVIKGGDNLMEMIDNASMPMLEVLNISGWKKLKSVNQLSNFVHLTKLSIEDCSSIESFPDHLLNLTHLSVNNCESMKSLPDLSNVTHLSIERCESLKSLPDLSNLTLLKHLKITYCPSIDYPYLYGFWPPCLCSLEIGLLRKSTSEWGPQNFPASLVDLELFAELEVSNFGQLSHIFPDSLTKLTINSCFNLESLSIGLEHLTSLQHLIIAYCPKMIHLPETLLPFLLSLRIYNCPELKERYGRGSHYWPLISHIPCIEIED